jgi:hypothetical protein
MNLIFCHRAKDSLQIVANRIPQSQKYDSGPTFSHVLSSATKEAPHPSTTSLCLGLAFLHVGKVAWVRGPEMREISNWKADRHAHLCRHHDNSYVISKKSENEECCTTSLIH